MGGKERGGEIWKIVEGERKEGGVAGEETEVWEIRNKGQNAAAGEKSHRGRETGRGRGTNTPKRWKMIETEQDKAKGDGD